MKKLIIVPIFEILLPVLSAVTMFFVVKILLNIIPPIWGIVIAIVMAIVIYFVLAFPLTSKYMKILLSGLKKGDNKIAK